MSNQESFLEWLSSRVSSSTLSDCYLVTKDIEDFAHKRKIFNGSLYETIQPATMSKLAAAISTDRFFRVTHKRQMKAISNMVRLLCKYAKECDVAEITPRKSDDQQEIEERAAHFTSEVPNIEGPKEVSLSDDTGVSVTCEKQEQSSDPGEKERTVQEILDENGIPLLSAGYGYLFVEREKIPDAVLKTIRRVESVVSVTSFLWYGKSCWRIRLKTADHSLETPAEESSSEMDLLGRDQANSRVQADVPSSVAEEDPVILLLNSMDIPYIDHRPKGGCLWIPGDMSIKETIASLRQQGYSFVYSYRGSKSVGWQSAWYLSEKSEKRQRPNEQPLASRNRTIDYPDTPAESSRPEELAEILCDDDMQLLREELVKHGIVSVRQLDEIKLWVFMNQYALYSISQRQDIYKRVRARLKAGEQVDRSHQYRLETRSAIYYGDSPAEAFVHFCEDLAQKYPLKIRALLDVQYNGNGSVVLSSVDHSGKSYKMMSPEAYINRDFTMQAVIVYGKWICKECGDNDPPIDISGPTKPWPQNEVGSKSVEQQGTADKTAKSIVQEERSVSVPVPTQGIEVEDEDVLKAEQIVLDADLEGISIEELSNELGSAVAATKRIIFDSKHIIQLGENLVHDGAFVDWEDGADQLEKILDKLLDRNGGYVSSTQLYEFARSEMQMFLNDNDIDDVRFVFDLAQHLFEKIGYHGKHFLISGKTHISRGNTAVESTLDLICNYARSQGGYFLEDDLVQYLQSVGVKTGNLRGIMKVYTQPIFMIYDKGQFIFSETMNVDDTWFSVARKALDKLFDNMGDHIVFRDIPAWWFAMLPTLPASKPWTLLLLQSVLSHYSKELGGAHTISARSGQSVDTIHAMLVAGNSEVQSFSDAVAALLIDDSIEQREFEAEELRLMLVRRGLINGSELTGNMPKTLENDGRYAWSADGRRVMVKV